MKNLILTLLFVVLFGVSSFAGGVGDRYEFTSGGSFHTEGFGSWHVVFERNGSFTAEHNVMGRIEKFPTMKLSEKDNKEIWKSIERMKPEKISSSHRSPVPDEVELGLNGIKVWSGDANDDKNISGFLDLTSSLIRKYCKKDAVIR